MANYVQVPSDRSSGQRAAAHGEDVAASCDRKEVRLMSLQLERTALRPELEALPSRLQKLPVDRRGYPVPWFVSWVNGEPEFRAMDAEKFVRAVKERRCWVCGDTLGVHLSFLIGPMCALNRTNAEPPCHHECAVWSARNCPFLSRPHMVRREDEVTNSARRGEASITRNPGCAAVWTTRSYRVFNAGKAAGAGYLFTMGEPERVEWFAHGRPATREEVIASIDSGLPILEATCDKETTLTRRLDARAALAKARVDIERLLPQGAVA